MTDEEKAEEYMCNIDPFLPKMVASKYEVTYSSKQLKQSYLDGLAEGRKEKENKDNCIDCEYVNLIIDKDNQISKLEKENAELKEQIEKMKCCENCKNWYEDNYSICSNCEYLGKLGD